MISFCQSLMFFSRTGIPTTGSRSFGSPISRFATITLLAEVCVLALILTTQDGRHDELLSPLRFLQRTRNQRHRLLVVRREVLTITTVEVQTRYISVLRV